VDQVSSTRRPPPPPLEANDQLVTAVITAAWAIALVTLLALWAELPPGSRWWIWTCAFGTGAGLFGLWYVPRLKRSRARLAKRRAEAHDAEAQHAEAHDTEAQHAEAHQARARSTEAGDDGAGGQL
jgi:type VI protein secretion system component VasK